jgi:hypothetical protein
MKPPATQLGLLLTTLFADPVYAGPRTSANYRVETDIANTCGNRTASASYTNDSSADVIAGVSTVAAPAETAKAGYPGQLAEVITVQLAATPPTVNEGGARQLAATATLDDATTTLLPGTEVNWNVVAGPITAISPAGVATAANVSQNTAATVQGSYRSIVGTLGLTIVNVGTDDLGIYASDGIPDTWQVQYFGAGNPLGAATADVSGTGQNNLFKYLAGLIPTDPASRFVTLMGTATGMHTITFSPRLPDRSYTVQFSTTLGGWQTLTGGIIQDHNQVRTVIDPDTTTTRKYYRVQIRYP